MHAMMANLVRVHSSHTRPAGKPSGRSRTATRRIPNWNHEPIPPAGPWVGDPPPVAGPPAPERVTPAPAAPAGGRAAVLAGRIRPTGRKWAPGGTGSSPVRRISGHLAITPPAASASGSCRR